MKKIAKSAFERKYFRSHANCFRSHADCFRSNADIFVPTQMFCVRTKISAFERKYLRLASKHLCLLPLMLHVIMATQREDIINVYFGMGLKYCDIVHALAIYHDIILSEKHVKRILKSMGLYSDITDVIDFIEQQLKESGKQHLFYRGHR